jgi:hypothetical protein
VLPIYRMMRRMLNFAWMAAIFCGIQIGRCLTLCAVVTDAHNIRKVSFWSHSIYMGCILFHVKFKVRLSILVLRDRAAHYKISKLEIEKFLKKSNVFNLRLCASSVTLSAFTISLLFLLFFIPYFYLFNSLATSLTVLLLANALSRWAQGNSFSIMMLFVF